jgi:hypothetical protein
MRKKHYEASPELIWAVKYVVDHLLNGDDIKQGWLDSLDPNHLWHPVRTLIGWLDDEDVFDRDDARLMRAAANASIKAAIDDGDLTEEALHEYEIEQGVKARLAAMSAAELELMAQKAARREATLTAPFQETKQTADLNDA